MSFLLLILITISTTSGSVVEKANDLLLAVSDNKYPHEILPLINRHSLRFCCGVHEDRGVQTYNLHVMSRVQVNFQINHVQSSHKLQP